MSKVKNDIMPGETPAHTALYYWNLPQLEYLISIKADLTATNNDGFTPLELSLNMVTLKGKEDVADSMRKLLHENTPNADTITTEFYKRKEAESASLTKQWIESGDVLPSMMSSPLTEGNTSLSQDIETFSQKVSGAAVADFSTE